MTHLITRMFNTLHCETQIMEAMLTQELADFLCHYQGYWRLIEQLLHQRRAQSDNKKLSFIGS